MARKPFVLALRVRFGERTPWGRLRAGVAAAFGFTMMLLAPGCGSLSCWQATGENVVRSRELASRGIDASQHGHGTEAEAMFGEAIKLCPNDESTRRHYAESLWQRGATDEAIAQMSRAAQLSGGSADSLVQLGEMRLSRNELELAADNAHKALAADRRLPSAWVLQGDTLRRQGDLEGALASYHRALSYQDSNPRAQMAVASLYRQTNRPERALATLQALAERYPAGEEPVDVLHLEGLVLRDLKRFEAAAETLAHAAASPRPSLELLYDLAESQLLAGHPERATAAAEQALALAPNHVPSRDLILRAQSHQQRMAANATIVR